ncbi:MAG: ROK family protein [Proteobacteria bacterium]|nr:ROK family protein [Pseudomonadota bacterium]
MEYRIGIDLGGTKIEIAALDGAGRIVERVRVATPEGDYAATLRVLCDLVTGMERTLGARGTVGIGMPGSLSPASGLVRNSNSVCLNGRPFKQDLEETLGREVRIENDANCFALSEAADGAGQGAAVVFGVILGTGVGGGIVVRGQVLRGANAIAGEWGHNPLPWPHPDELPGRACFCGRAGCIETFLSGPGLAADHARAAGSALAGEEIVSRALAGDAACNESLGRYEERLARALASVVNILDPDVIVLGGGLSNVRRWYETVPRLWERWIFSDVIRTRLVPHVHGDSGGVRGAAWLWGGG